jgi:hypothetical protein
MVSAIQTVSSIDASNQIASLQAASQLARQAKPLLMLSDGVVSLDSTTVLPLTYNASGSLDKTSSARSTVVDNSALHLASITTTKATTSTQSIALGSTAQASSSVEDTSALDTALKTSLTQQLAINASVISSGLTALPAALETIDASLAASATDSETVRLIDVTRQAITDNSATTLENLLATSINLTSTLQNATSSTDTVANANNAAVIQSPTPEKQSTKNEADTAVANVPVTTTTAAVASSTASTGSLDSTAEITAALVNNSTVDSGIQAVAIVAQNQAYANMVAGYYVSTAAASAQPPSITIVAVRIQDVQPVIAISAVGSLTQLGAQSGRDGNPPTGYRQR